MIKDGISVIIPVYNGREELETCIGSVLAQTYRELEVLCVDDGSDDGTQELLEKICEEDARVRGFCMKENQGPLAARRRGVEEAKGRYILFLDGDDRIDTGLLEELVQEERREEADILHFSVEVVDCGVRSFYLEGTKEFVRPYKGKLLGSEIPRFFFEEAPRGWHLWGKLYSSRICKKVFRSIRGNYRNGEDLLAFYLLALNAGTYRGLETENRYVYHLGRGLIGTGEIGMKEFRIFCQAGKVFSAIEEGCRELGLAEREKENLWQIKRRLLFDNVWVFWNRLEASGRGEGIRALSQAWGKEEEILREAVEELFYGDYFRLKAARAVQIAEKRHLEILLYPYGEMGRRLERELKEQAGISVKKADQNTGRDLPDVLSLKALAEDFKARCLCVICSNRREIYEEIRQAAYSCFAREQVYDFFPEPEQKYIWEGCYGT